MAQALYPIPSHEQTRVSDVVFPTSHRTVEKPSNSPSVFEKTDTFVIRQKLLRLSTAIRASPSLLYTLREETLSFPNNFFQQRFTSIPLKQTIVFAILSPNLENVNKNTKCKIKRYGYIMVMYSYNYNIDDIVYV